MEVASDGNVGESERVFDLVWNADRLQIARTEGDLERRRDDRVGEVDYPISSAWANGLLQIHFPYFLLDVAQMNV